MTSPTLSPRRYVLLDRDGTINVEKHYLSDPEQMELYPGVGEALRRLQDLGFGLAVITNQSGIGRGYFSLDTLGQIHDRMKALLAPFGVTIDGIYLCPHAPDEDCSCRKPLPGMVEQAMAELKFDPKQAFLVGDKTVDVDLAHAVGAVGVLVRTGHGKKHVETCKPAYIADDLPDAAAWIEQQLKEGH